MPYLSPRSVVQHNQIQRVNLLTKDELNKQDREGRTLLHWAVIFKNVAMVKALLAKGCRLDIGDNALGIPLNYTLKDSEIEQLLIKKGSLNKGCTALHLAAKEGDVKKIKAILAKNKYAHMRIDNAVDLPISYAAYHQKEEAVKVLIERGSFVDWINRKQQNLVHLSQVNGKDTALSEYLKKQIAPSEQELAHIVESFKKILKKEHETAKKLNKRLAVILGEMHGSYSILTVEKAFLKVAKEMGINQFYMELPSIDGGKKFEIELEAQRLKMKSDRFDDHLYRKEASVDQRNIVMTKKVALDDKDCVMVVGALHIKGIIHKKSVRLPSNQYHVVPFNLGPIAAPGTHSFINLIKNNSAEARRFIDDASNVIQVSRKGMSVSTEALKKHNDNKPSTKSRSAFIALLALVTLTVAVMLPLYQIYQAIGLFLTMTILVVTATTGFLMHQFIEKQKTFGLKEYQNTKEDLSGIQQIKLKAFMDGATPTLYNKLTSLFSYRDWRYMRDYYAGCAAKEVEKEKLIGKVKARLG